MDMTPAQELILVERVFKTLPRTLATIEANLLAQAERLASILAVDGFLKNFYAHALSWVRTWQLEREGLIGVAITTPVTDGDVEASYPPPRFFPSLSALDPLPIEAVEDVGPIPGEYQLLKREKLLIDGEDGVTNQTLDAGIATCFVGAAFMPGSETVLVNGTPQAYLIDYTSSPTTGGITLVVPPVGGETLNVTFTDDPINTASLQATLATDMTTVLAKQVSALTLLSPTEAPALAEVMTAQTLFADRAGNLGRTAEIDARIAQILARAPLIAPSGAKAGPSYMEVNAWLELRISRDQGVRAGLDGINATIAYLNHRKAFVQYELSADAELAERLLLLAEAEILADERIEMATDPRASRTPIKSRNLYRLRTAYQQQVTVLAQVINQLPSRLLPAELTQATAALAATTAALTDVENRLRTIQRWMTDEQLPLIERTDTIKLFGGVPQTTYPFVVRVLGPAGVTCIDSYAGTLEVSALEAARTPLIAELEAQNRRDVEPWPNLPSVEQQAVLARIRDRRRQVELMKRVEVRYTVVENPALFEENLAPVDGLATVEMRPALNVLAPLTASVSDTTNGQVSLPTAAIVSYRANAITLYHTMIEAGKVERNKNIDARLVVINQRIDEIEAVLHRRLEA